MLISKPEILFLCWEYEGYNSAQTTALVRRPRYFAESLIQDGFSVTVLFTSEEQVDSTYENEAGGKLRLISIPSVKQEIASSKLLNKFRTLIQLAKHGDFSGKWHEALASKIDALDLKFDIVVAFFTPRGPLYSAYLLKERYTFKSIFDIQDPYHEGLSGGLSKTIVKKRFRKVMRSADVVFCVNKEWTRELEIDFGIKASYLPHVIEDPIIATHPKRSQENGKIVFFYSGSLEQDVQDPGLFFRCLEKLKKSGLYDSVEFRYAGNESKHNYFSTIVPVGVKYTYMGWLSKVDLFEEINKADVLCVFPMTSRTYKTCIPSKFFEFCRFPKPILIIGDDTGAFADEMGESFDREFLVRTEQRFFEKIEAYSIGDASGFFHATEEFTLAYSLPVVYQQFIKQVLC